MKNFALMGVGGYIAPRHLEAIKATGNNLVAATDPNDSVGVIDRYFPDVHFFRNVEQFGEYLFKNPIQYLSICTPNYLHRAHIAVGLRFGADVICEKPLVLHSRELNELAEMEQMTGRKVNTVLQLRVHDSMKKLREKVLATKKNDKYDVDLSYFTSRGPWFHESWKGNYDQSGGLPTNIGVHFFDMLTWFFGKKEKSEVHVYTPTICAGYLELEKARVRWVLSVDKNLLPEAAKKAGKSTYRSILFEGEELEFSEGFTDLHTVVYKDILAGRGYGLEDARASIEIVEELRELSALGLNQRSHPLLRK